MRSTLSAHKALALLLSAVIVLEGAGTAAWASEENPAESCLLLKLSSSSVPQELARERLTPIPGLLLRELNVRWVSPPAVPAPRDIKDIFPEADDASLEKISRTLAEAHRSMDRMDTREAEALLSEAESQARNFRLGDRTRPLIAEIFLRRGLLKLWEGNAGEAEEMFSRSRVMRPDFSPDPALFSPAFRDSWTRSTARRAPDAELLAHSIPPGASVSVDGNQRGTTPCRISVSPSGPVRIRLSMAGYQDAHKTGQWLPGDSESLEWVLTRDRVATLEELLASSPDGKGSGKLLAELASTAGASRVVLLLLEDRKSGSVGRVLISGKGDSDPVSLGEFEWHGGDDGAAEAAGATAKMLRDAGWPPAKGSPHDPESPWYHKWWVWLLVGAIAVGVAAGGGGGGGSSGGGSTGSVGVSF